MNVYIQAFREECCSGRYPEILPKDTLPKDTLPKDILPNGHFADGHFVERTFCRTDSMTNGLFAGRTFCRNDNLPKIEKFGEKIENGVEMASYFPYMDVARLYSRPLRRRVVLSKSIY